MSKFLILILSVAISPVFPLIGALAMSLSHLELNVNKTADSGIITIVSLCALAQVLWLVAVFALGVQV
jgi:hypothetical protein